MLWPSSGSTCITMENSVQTTLRLRTLARGPVWICQSFLEGSTLVKRVRGREEDRQKEQQRRREREREWERKANMVKQVLVKNR